MIFTYMSTTYRNSSRPRELGTVERFIEPCILLLLYKNSSHGYGLMEDLEKHCGEKVDIGNLYRTLRRMEMNGWITSDWSKNESGPDRRTYTISKKGLRFLKTAIASLVRTDTIIRRLLTGYKETFGKEQISV